MQCALSIQKKLALKEETLVEPNDPVNPQSKHWARHNDIVITWI